MEEEMTFTSWDQYFKQVEIYQGRSHWTGLKKLILKF